ncbi:MAG: hypothetical protein KGQ41_09210 [Alphaproteobacteria bacterium]|nr:hypothetical protein [Alphaproteobacteria bacterium]
MQRIKARLAETFIHGPRRRARGSFKTSASGVPLIPPIEVQARLHRADIPWRRREVFDEAQATVPDNPSPTSAYIVLGATFGTLAAGCFAIWITMPDNIAPSSQTLKDRWLLSQPIEKVGPEAWMAAKARMAGREKANGHALNP